MGFIIDSGYGWTDYNSKTWTKKLQYCAKKIHSLRKEYKIDALAYTGSSGAAAAYVLGVALDLPVVYVRKTGENSHGHKVESNTRKIISHYLIIDDFICTGNTIERIVNGIEKYAKDISVRPPTCVGVFLYSPTDQKNSISVVINRKKRNLKIFR